MLRTITLGTCVSVQGLQVGQLPDGQIIVRVDEKNYVGNPITLTRKSCSPSHSADHPTSKH
jgi:hypothetical protein